ncbi:hypothetical protein IscW_ISCW019908 [Ixodes scapularis]|uniref:Uncharacterized protein n=1 Tax=Ixodes scapularis TaxID=6945 RepID=B7PV89_IXOSC|nr:hypothetical protein IscW_ISCW019908 [Ixodes scapularis]|eukprot:XP_002407542.1 hypothetical protein IscW_ISCW019908 [Ixodes scapularis]
MERGRLEARVVSDKSAIDADSIGHHPDSRNAKERTLLDSGHPFIKSHWDLMIIKEPEASTTDKENHSELNNGR